ncbi:unnamed protein product [Linum trigynum]
MDSDELVSSLIDKDNGSWDESKLKEKFSRLDYELISKTSLRTPLCRDERVWIDSDDGNYYVKSAYYRIRENLGNNSAYSLTVSMDELEFWKAL